MMAVEFLAVEFPTRGHRIPHVWPCIPHAERCEVPCTKCHMCVKLQVDCTVAASWSKVLA